MLITDIILMIYVLCSFNTSMALRLFIKHKKFHIHNFMLSLELKFVSNYIATSQVKSAFLWFLPFHGLIFQVKSIWFLPFAYVFVARNVGNIVEALSCGNTLKAWWNWQRMWVIQRTTSFFFGFIDTISRKLGLSETTFALTTKVGAEDVLKRYRQEVIEFGSPTIMLTIIATLALLNLFSLIGEIRKIVLDFEFKVLDQLIMQVILNLLLVLINIPVYQGLFIRNDKGHIPSLVLFKSIVLASLACLIPIIWHSIP